MSLLLNQPSKLCFRKPMLVRSSPHLSNDLSASVLHYHSHSIVLISADPCGGNRGRTKIRRSGGLFHKFAFEDWQEIWQEIDEKDSKLIDELRKEMGTIGSSNGWLPTLKDGVLRLRDMNLKHDADPKRILLPPLVTLPHCQTQYVTNVAMSLSSPEEEDCVLAVKFLGPQLSFCRFTYPCFFSSPVMFSKKDDMFRIASSGGHLIGSWDLHKHSKNPSFRACGFKTFPSCPRPSEIFWILATQANTWWIR